MDVKIQGPFNVTGKEVQDACIKLAEVASLFANTDYPTASGLAGPITAALQIVSYEWTDAGVKVLTTPHRVAELNRHYAALVDAGNAAIEFMVQLSNGTYEDPAPETGRMTEAEVNDLWDKEQEK